MKDKIKELFEIADLETRSGNFDKAIESYRKILSMPDATEQATHLCYWGMGEIFLNNNNYDDAEHYLSKAVWLAPQESYYHYLLGCTYTYKNEIEKAIHHLEKAVELDDTIEIYWGQLGWVVGYNKNYDRGVEYLKKALRINPKNYQSLRDLCMLYTKNQKFDEALACIEKAEKYYSDVEEIQLFKNQIEFFKKEFERLS